MNGNLELALSWFKVADEDLLAAEHELRYEDAVLRTICFHSQQSVEKYLKGFLIYHNIEYPFTHNITLLISKIKEFELAIEFSDLSADLLTAYAVEARYPDPDIIISQERAKQAFLIALEVKNRIMQKLKLNL